MEENKILYGDVETKQEAIPELDVEELLKRYNAYQQEMQPYREGLQDYINQYNDLQKQAFNRDRYLAGVAGWTGNQNFANMMGKYSPANMEANRLQLVKELANQNIEKEKGIDEMIGNASIAQSLGLRPEVALGGASLLKSLAPVMSSANALKGRIYSADISLERAKLINASKEKIAQMNNNRAMAIAQGTWSTQKEIAFNRDKANLQRAMVTALGFGTDPTDLFGATNAMDLTNIDINRLNDLLNQ